MEKSRLVLIQSGEWGHQHLISLLRLTGAEVIVQKAKIREPVGSSLKDVDLFVIVYDPPSDDAMNILRGLRCQEDTPIVVVGPDDDHSLISYLDAGADDYLSVAWSDAVLLARVRSVLRCARASRVARVAPCTYDDGHLYIDVQRRRVHVNDVEVGLTPMEFELLRYLLLHHHEAQSFERILLNVWDKTCLGRRHYVHTYIARLRKRLEEDPQAPVYVRTVYGVGYRFVGKEGAIADGAGEIGNDFWAGRSGPFVA